jgi:amidohydrolase
MVESSRVTIDHTFDDMVDVRRWLHAHPELSFEEHRTSSMVRERMTALGATVERCPTETGAVFSFDGGVPGHTVLIRGDIDALPVTEEVDLPFRSVHDGVMHACGHDAHTAMLLGVADSFAGRLESLPGRYIFLFQPAEERVGGAKAMIEGGVLDDLSPTRALGCHVISLLPVGTVGMRSGIAMADAQALRIELSGAGGHGSTASTQGNVILAVSDLAASLPGVVEGITFEGVAGACNAGVVQAGTALNVLPRTAHLEGTLRTFTPEQKTDACGRLQALCDRVAERFEVEVDLAIGADAPPVTNDPAVTQLVEAAARRSLPVEQVITLPPLPASDDVSEFLNRVPGCYFFVGAARADGTSGMHHSPTFSIDEEALRVGATVLADAAVELARRRQATPSDD